MSKKLMILEQDADYQTVKIFVKMLVRICCQNGLMDEVIVALKDCDFEYKVEEV